MLVSKLILNDLACKGATYLRNLKIYKNRVTGHIYERCSGVVSFVIICVFIARLCDIFLAETWPSRPHHQRAHALVVSGGIGCVSPAFLMWNRNSKKQPKAAGNRPMKSSGPTFWGVWFDMRCPGEDFMESKRSMRGEQTSQWDPFDFVGMACPTDAQWISENA